MTAQPGRAPLIYESLLDRLLQADTPLLVHRIAQENGVSTDSVVRQIERLRGMGCVLESHPQHGVRLIQTPQTTWSDYLRWRDRRRGRSDRIIEVYRNTASTQDVVRRIVMHRGEAADAAVAIADEQSAGRGRQGRQWIAPPGSSVLMSRAWVPATLSDQGGQAGKPFSIDRIMFASAVAMARALESATLPHPLPVSIKWPNDLLIKNAKIAGILVETFQVRGRWAAVIGVGVNVDLRPEHLPDTDLDLRRRVTSLSMLGRSVDRLRVLSAALESLDETLAQTDLKGLIAEWRRRSTVLAHRVRLRSDGQRVEGQVIDLDPYEGLIVRNDTGEILHLPAATTTVE